MLAFVIHSHKAGNISDIFCKTSISVRRSLSASYWSQNRVHILYTLWDMTTCVKDMNQFHWECDFSSQTFFGHGRLQNMQICLWENVQKLYNPKKIYWSKGHWRTSASSLTICFKQLKNLVCTQIVITYSFLL